MSDLKEHTFLGKGWAFPPSFNFHQKTSNMVAADKDIKESLIILLSTMKNERVMRPDYGTEIIKHVFDEMNNSLHHYIIDLITNAILLNEPRVDIENITLDMEMEKIIISIDYIIRSTNSRQNLVYPYFITQGTNVDAHDRIY